ncbi:MAG: SMC-Scp complex subunit ScpB [Phycisphaerales bacterium]
MNAQQMTVPPTDGLERVGLAGPAVEVDAHAARGAGASGTPEAVSDEVAERIRTMAPMVEALVISGSRALSATRIAQALGLLPPTLVDEATTDAPAPPAHSTPPAAAGCAAEDGPALAEPRRRKRRSGAQGEADGPNPIELIARSVAWLNAEYDRTGRAFRIEQVAGGYRVMTLPAFGSAIAALQGAATRTRLSHEALVTLSIIAYRQPVKRVDLEAIRGVACGEVLKSLLDRKLVTIAGRAEELGRPMLYATTREFLRSFGLSSIKDLPTPHDLGLKA